METDGDSIQKICEECGAVFELAQEKKKSVKERLELFPDVAATLEQELICCEECATFRMIKLL